MPKVNPKLLTWARETAGLSLEEAAHAIDLNDANHWAIETMKNPKYPLELFLRVITVSLDTMKIVKALPKLDVLEG